MRSRMWTTAVACSLALAVPLAAQESPLADFVLTGYGTASYDAGLDDFESGFTASVSPVLLYRMGDDLLFESELEFEVEGAGTNLVLEYAQVDYLGFERFQVSVGKFLLPFGVFGERLHPSWINKLPTMPLLYGHAHGGQASGALLPVLSDIGLMGRYNLPLGGLNLDLSLFVTQGPMMVEEGGLEPDDHSHARTAGVAAAPGHEAEADPLPTAFAIPEVAFGVSFPDNNKNKMLGLRAGLVSGPGFEVYVSGFHAMYDPDDYLDLTGLSASLEYRRGSGELRAEGAVLRQEFDDGGVFRSVSTPGYYVQYAYRLGKLEPVVRWSQLLAGEVDEVTANPERNELSLGLEYWVGPSVPIKLAYALNSDAEDRLILQWAFGF